MSSRKGYEETLGALHAMLKAKPMTARAVARVLKCCKPTAYQRLRELRKRGAVLLRVKVRESVTGPESTAYGVL